MRNLVLGASVLLVGACGPSERPDGSGQPDAGQQQQGDGGQQFPTSRVYAHSGSKLYQVNTQNFAAVEIGTMSGLGTQSLTDIAIDKGDKMVGITLDKLYELDPATGSATLINDLSAGAQNFTSLSYVPMDLNNAASPDILVSANSFGEIYQIDSFAGTATLLGDMGEYQTKQIGSSGDLIGVRGFGIYATVNVGTDTTAQDYLARIDPQTWSATIVGSGTGFNDIFGLAYWEGKIFGFVSMGSGAGKIITIDPSTGVGSEVLPGAVRWYGAGVATDAPILQ